MSRYSGKLKPQPRRSIISKSKENEVEKLVKDIENLDENCKSLGKDSRLLTESYNSVIRSELEIVHELMTYSSDPGFRQQLDLWAEMIQSKSDSMQAMSQLLTKGLSDPVKKFSSFLPTVSASNKKREQSLQEVMRLQARLEKYEDKERTGPNIVKLQESRKSLGVARDRYAQMTDQLCDDVPKLYESRLTLMRPALQSLVLGQMSLYNSLHQSSSTIADALGQDVDMLLQGSSAEDHLTQRLAEITALSIVVDANPDQD